jgi:hypothetical protein
MPAFDLAEEQARGACPWNLLCIVSALQRPRDSDEHCEVGHGNELLGVMVGLGVQGTAIDGRPVAGGRIRPAGFVPSLGG